MLNQAVLLYNLTVSIIYARYYARYCLVIVRKTLLIFNNFKYYYSLS